jgi:dTDP-4-dehydrorhamnose reductase
MKILVTGARGMLGSDLCPRLAARHEVVAWDLPELDVTDTDAVMRGLTAERPDAVVHCAAFANVDGCERDCSQAYRVNALGTWNVAAACREVGAAMVYISTDFIFDGEKGAPYDEFDAPHPLGEYGRSKLAGEIVVRGMLERHFIVRTAWLFGVHGKNFVSTILRAAQGGGPLRVVADQIGCPTHAVDLADTLVSLLDSPLYGTYHVTNAGSCSWAEFAAEIVRQAGLSAEVIPIAAAEWESPTRRPKDSRLRHLALEMQGKDTLPPWQDALAEYLRLRAAMDRQS